MVGQTLTTLRISSCWTNWAERVPVGNRLPAHATCAAIFCAVTVSGVVGISNSGLTALSVPSHRLADRLAGSRVPHPHRGVGRLPVDDTRIRRPRPSGFSVSCSKACDTCRACWSPTSWPAIRSLPRELLPSVTHRRVEVPQQPGRELPSADQGPRTGDETLRLAGQAQRFLYCVRSYPRAFSAPSSPDQRAPVAKRDDRSFRGLGRNHRRCGGLKPRSQPSRLRSHHYIDCATTIPK